MRRVPGTSLWLGHVGDARNPGRLFDEGILAVVDLAINEPPVTLTREMLHCRFPLIDGGGNPRWMLRAAVETVASLLRAHVPTLVYCGACMSRTPSVAGASIALVRGIDLEAGLLLAIQGGGADVAPDLWSDIVDAMA